MYCVTDKSIGDTSDIISDSSGVGTNSDSAVCSIGHPSTTVVCIEPYSSATIGHLSIQTGEVIEVLGSTDCGLLEGYVRGTNRSGFFPAEVVQEVNIRQKNITNVSTEQRSTFQKRQDMQQQQQQQPPQQPQTQLESFCVRIITFLSRFSTDPEKTFQQNNVSVLFYNISNSKHQNSSRASIKETPFMVQTQSNNQKMMNSLEIMDINTAAQLHQDRKNCKSQNPF